MDWINKLMDLPKYGAGIGLHRIDYLCRDIQSSSWWENLDSINIVGTNGKGSTAVMISGILEQLGFVTGQYTSPHLIHFSERIQVGGEPIEQPDLIRLIQSFFDQKKQYELAFPGDFIGAFEAFTSIGLHYFYEKKPDVLVLEAGIGGRFDPTRMGAGRFIGLTSVDLEHTQLLGNTLEEIAMDKIDIAQAGSTVIIGNVPAEVERKLRAYAGIKGVELITLGQESSIHQIRYEGNGMKVDFSLDGLEFKSLLCPLVGPHQLNNLMLAILLVKKWLAYKQLGIEDSQLVRATQLALEQLRWPGRFEKLCDVPPVYVDVGHTPQAMQQLVLTAKKAINGPILLVFGLSKGRAPAPMLAPWLPHVSEVFLTEARHRSLGVGQLAKSLAENAPDGKKAVFKNMEEAIEEGLKKAQQEGKTIIITGSLFLAMEARAYLQGVSPGSLRFF
jgi:dihydrofolate synthase/folylpolyglutamate synthase